MMATDTPHCDPEFPHTVDTIESRNDLTIDEAEYIRLKRLHG
jgi:hypothetical protein